MKSPLQFETAARTLLEQFSLQLRSIQWYRSFDFNFVLDIGICTHIRELSIPASPQLTNFLHSFGASLESLNVSFKHFEGYEEIIDLIEHNCTKLATLSFSEWLPEVETVSDERCQGFLCSFGSQLRCGQVLGVSLGKLARVLQACPNLLVGTEYVANDGVHGWERISLLGSMIKNMIVVTGMYCGDKCEQAIARCIDLESLAVIRDYVGEEEVIESSSNMTCLLSISSSSLNYFEHHGFIGIQPNIGTLSSPLRNLRYLALDSLKAIVPII